MDIPDVVLPDITITAFLYSLKRAVAKMAEAQVVELLVYAGDHYNPPSPEIADFLQRQEWNESGGTLDDDYARVIRYWNEHLRSPGL